MCVRWCVFGFTICTATTQQTQMPWTVNAPLTSTENCVFSLKQTTVSSSDALDLSECVCGHAVANIWLSPRENTLTCDACSLFILQIAVKQTVCCANCGRVRLFENINWWKVEVCIWPVMVPMCVRWCVFGFTICPVTAQQTQIPWTANTRALASKNCVFILKRAALYFFL